MDSKRRKVHELVLIGEDDFSAINGCLSRHIIHAVLLGSLFDKHCGVLVQRRTFDLPWNVSVQRQRDL